MQCVDASLVIQFAANPKNEAVRLRWEQWLEDGETFTAPTLLGYEVLNGLHRYVVRRELSATAVDQAWQLVMALPIELVHTTADHDRALAIARRFNRPATYDPITWPSPNASECRSGRLMNGSTTVSSTTCRGFISFAPTPAIPTCSR